MSTASGSSSDPDAYYFLLDNDGDWWAWGIVNDHWLCVGNAPAPFDVADRDPLTWEVRFQFDSGLDEIRDEYGINGYPILRLADVDAVVNFLTGVA